MESRERDRDGEARPRRHLSSLVVRPSTSESDVEEKAAAAASGGGRGRGGGGGEEGEKRLRAGESFYARSNRLHDGRRSHQGLPSRPPFEVFVTSLFDARSVIFSIYFMVSTFFLFCFFIFV